MKPNSSKIPDFFTVSLFFALLGALTLLTIFLPRRTFSESENRALQTLPTLSGESLTTRDPNKKFTAKYETYVADQFVLRDAWVTWKNETEILLGKKDLGGVYLSENDYLIAKEPDYSEKGLAENLNFAKTFLERLTAVPTVERSVVALAPDSGEVLQTLLPPFATTYDAAALYNTTRTTLGDIHTASLSPTLFAHENEYLYYRTDHHWTSLGAYYAYQALAEHLGYTAHSLMDYRVETVTDSFLGTYQSKVSLPWKADSIETYTLQDGAPSLQVDDQTAVTDTLYAPAALDGKDKYTYFLGGNKPLITITTSVKNQKTLLLIKDSYANSLLPFLSAHYEKILCVDLRYYRESVTALAATESVTDVLILYQAMNFTKDGSVFKLIQTS